MNQHLQNILTIIQQDENLSAEQKTAISKSLKDAEKELEITAFKLDRTEKVKKTTAILLEETIEELEQKRKAVEAKNRELEVESSLERVRAVAMGMNKPDDLLDICKQLYKELQVLGFGELRNAMIHTFFDEKKYFINYDFSDPTGGRISSLPYSGNQLMEQFIKEMRKKNAAFSELEVAGQELENWKAFRKTNGEYEDPRLNDIQALYYYNYAVGESGIGISTYSAINDEKLTILKRFRNVFDLAYKRYIDITKAEAQAREAKIEAALERVRSRTMGMQKSEELKEVIQVVYEQFVHLNIFIEHTGFIIDYKARDDMHIWLADRHAVPFQVTFPYFYCAHWNSFNEAKEKGLDFFANHLSFEEKNKFYQDLFEVIPGLPEEAKEYYFNCPGLAISTVLLENVGLYIENFSGIPYTDEENNTLMRFGKVFQQTYTRFLDLQKAEAQAREAQIEAALERVRSRSLAMHHSDELREVIGMVYILLSELKVKHDTIAIQVFDFDNKSSVLWPRNTLQNVAPKVVFPYDEDIMKEDTCHRALWEAMATGKSIINKVYTKQQKDRWFEYIFAHNDYTTIEEHSRQFLLELETLVVCFFPEKYSGLYAESWDGTKYSEDDIDVLKRAARVFEQAYVRFLDLQKSEAQARESQIELGLERVRARAMAMQKSDELSELVDTVFKELTKLDFALTWCIINIIDEDSMSNTVWAANPDINKAPESYHMLFEDYPFHHAMMKGWKERKAKHVYTLEGLEKKVYDEYLFKETEFRRVPEAAQAASRAMEKYVVTFSFSNFGGLQTVGDVPLSDANLDILSRFGKVFDLTYTRFNDLKQAEAQAREAQIQLAMERVRARTMAMQHSEELAEVATILFQQVKALGVPQWVCGFSIWEIGDKEFTWYPGSPDGDILTPCQVPLTEHPVFIQMDESRKRGDELLVFEKEGEIQADHYRYMQSLPGMRELLQDVLDAGMQIPTFQIDHYANFSHGDLVFITYEHFPEMHDIFKRFAKVFEQTYTRFLDLQKAEAQAREAQIEAALERTRTHSMLMQHSNELDITSRVFHEQLLLLGIESEFSYVWLPEVEKEKHLFWSTWTKMENDSTVLESKSVIYDLDRTEPYTAECFNAWESGEPVHVYPIVPAAVQQYFDTWSGIFSDAEKMRPEFFPDGLYYVESFMKYGCFGIIIHRPPAEDEKKILLRFTIEFERTYTRFLDLQKAEAQAREAQIEAALERVRSRAMAMHKTDELLDAAELVSKELSALGIESMNVSYAFVDEEEKYASYYSLNPVDGKIPPFPFVFPHAETDVMRSILSSWKKQEPFNMIELDEEATLKHQSWVGEHIQQLITKNNIDIPFSVEAFLAISPKKAVIYTFNFTKGYLFNIGGVRLTKMQEEMVLRFTKVFEMTYRRFLDLKQAEVQTREAQIELGLERVRARAMAMQNSEELNALIGTVFTELTKLDLVLTRCVIMIYDPANNDARWWMANSEAPEQPMNFLVKYHEHLPNQSYFNAWQQRTIKWEYILQGTIKKEWDDFLFSETELSLLPDFVIAGMRAPDKVYLNASFNNFGNLTLASLEQLSDEHFDILLRFAKVFDLTYTRFNDLQKAEAQARESQIQLALERVRARTMAMQKSEELPQAANLLFQQVQSLGMPAWSAGYCKWDEDKRAISLSMSSEGVIQPTLRMPLTEDPSLMHFREAWERGESFFVEEVGGEELKRHYAYLRTLPGVKETLDEIEEAGFPVPTFQIFHLAYFSKGFLLFITYEPVPEAHDIFKRFAKVFEQTYTRFLDLQKAEAQAREAKIETALEKVRSRSLAMHRSEELQEVVTTVFERLKELDIQTDAINLDVFNENKKDAYLWTAVPGHNYSKAIHIPYTDITIFKDIYDGMVGGKVMHSKVYSRELKDEFLNYIFEYTDFREIPQERKDMLFATDGSTVSVTYAKNTAIIAQRYANNPFSEDENEILKRFANVFEQCYTRFKDLEKAEAQAREAQIEAALERVRSRTMAMQRSEELLEVINIFSDQLTKLNIYFDNVSFGVNDQADDFKFWLSSAGQPHPIQIQVPYYDHPAPNRVLEAQKKGLKFFADTLTQEENKLWIQHLVDHSELKALPDNVKNYLLTSPGFARSTFILKNINLYIGNFKNIAYTEEENNIFKRFAQAFEQSYIRFLDLQKAEAQAREAKIEAALERVRAKAMAMHKSDDLHGAVTIMFEEFQKLNLDVLRCGIGILNKDARTGTVWATSVSDNELAVQISANESFDTHPLMMLIYECWQKQEDLDYVLQGQDLINYYKAMEASELKLPESQLFFPDDEPQSQYYYAAMFKAGGLYSFRDKPFAAEDRKIMKRFASVVNLTYNRFLDLQKAEANAREAQIEAGLERVRARTMAMHNSEDVSAATATMFTELEKLGIENFRGGIAILLPNRTQEVWSVTNLTESRLSDGQGKIVKAVGTFNIDDHPYWQHMYSEWEDKKEFLHYFLAGKDKDDFVKVLTSAKNYLPQDVQHFPDVHLQVYYFNEGAVFTNSLQPHSEEDQQVMKRFTSVFSLTFRRYQDLKKAEAQAREAQIELGLERVRARAMAMQISNELNDLVAILFEELTKLDLVLTRCIIWILNNDTMSARLWMANSEYKKAAESYYIKRLQHSYYEAIIKGWKKRTSKWVYDLRGQEKKTIDKLLLNETELSRLPEAVKNGILNSEHTIVSGSFNNFGLLEASGPVELSEEQMDIVSRFAKVFDLTYTRFNDLKQAEAQAREAQIEAGLERVRARTMAMHSSDDVSTATATMFAELEKLGIESFRGGILNIRADQTMDVWSVNNLAEGKIVRAAGEFDMTMHPFWQQLYKGWTDKDEVLYFNMSGKDKEDYIRILDARRDYLPDRMQELPDSHIQSYYFGEGFIWTFTLQPHSEEDKQVMKKFASVFSLTFRRYQDLKKAEAQAREATIEAALERVRGKAMAMHSSKDLATTIEVFYHELESLNLTPRRCGVGLINKETQTAEISTMNATVDGQSIELVGKLDMRSHPVLKAVYNNWLTKTEYHPVLRGNEIKEYYQVVRPQISFPGYPHDSVQYGYFFFFDDGGVYAWTEKELNEDELKIYRRFTSVLSLTYKRYKDLRDAEHRTQIAIKDAALDRIRADIASMRTINDLDRITPLIWNELTILGIPFIRCGVFIMDEEQQLLHTFLSTPDGKAIAAFHLSYTTPGNIQQVLSNWRNKKNYIDHWDESEFTQFAEILVKQGALASAEQYLKTIPKGGFYLHFLPFLQGMLYVGNTTQLKVEEIELIQHVADAFSTAYARYEDFNKLEAAKQQVDKTLTDLKQAQTQLVQSEKMASLGELTAGIAHEIQNPLNFVNNFSEVSKELLDEMNEELNKGNLDDAKNIAGDVIQNLEKILHHGKRADGIVKGMLQHSRTSSGQKELTDINALADEYLRLAYHGLRAKNKTFNAAIKTDFDENTGLIKIIPQDIGRVILNLITNAFYAANEKKKLHPENFEPVVTVSTKKLNDKIEVGVSDNGTGISQKVLEKIFQPFFTTKPTGQGTGLGLSLSYDIVKAHGGELKVETKEGEGTEFIMQLPVNN